MNKGNVSVQTPQQCLNELIREETIEINSRLFSKHAMEAS